MTSSRYYVDYIATEFYMVRVKQRSDALISIATPRLRDSMPYECKDLYGW